MKRFHDTVEAFELAHLCFRVASLAHFDGALPASLVSPLSDTEFASSLEFPELEKETSLRGLDHEVGKEGLESRNGRSVEETPMGERSMPFAPVTTNADRAPEGLREEIDGGRRCHLSCSKIDAIEWIDHALPSPFIQLEITISVHHARQVWESCAIP